MLCIVWPVHVCNNIIMLYIPNMKEDKLPADVCFIITYEDDQSLSLFVRYVPLFTDQTQSLIMAKIRQNKLPIMDYWAVVFSRNLTLRITEIFLLAILVRIVFTCSNQDSWTST